ncbi:MAG: class I SAM-dependent methyltransferase [Chloroflexi bacterium]|nr:MAG: class I SAM-dependent methyltransferase [Chloroflexota bacterium]
METAVTVKVSESALAAAAQQRESLVEKMLGGMEGFVTHYTIYLGARLGYYDVLARHDDLNSTELATLTGTNERYTREWLEQQAVFGILQVRDARAGARERRYALPAGHAEVLTEPDSLNYLAPFSRLLVGMARPIDELVAAFRSGKGVPYKSYGEDMREGQAGMNRATFLQELSQVWIPAMQGVHTRLQEPGARIADFGCGYGWSSIGMAKAFPQARIDGYDLDAPSIEQARKNAQAYGVNDRVNFEVRDVSSPELSGRYDLVTALECVHDMADPVGALRAMRRMVNGTGSVLVVDERVGETFATQGEENEMDWMMYGFSVLHCLPVGMAEQPSAATGTVMRPETLRKYAREAGFQEVEVLPVENFFFRLYRLIP